MVTLNVDMLVEGVVDVPGIKVHICVAGILVQKEP